MRKSLIHFSLVLCICFLLSAELSFADKSDFQDTITDEDISYAYTIANELYTHQNVLSTVIKNSKTILPHDISDTDLQNAKCVYCIPIFSLRTAFRSGMDVLDNLELSEWLSVMQYEGSDICAFTYQMDKNYAEVTCVFESAFASQVSGAIKRLSDDGKILGIVFNGLYYLIDQNGNVAPVEMLGVSPDSHPLVSLDEFGKAANKDGEFWLTQPEGSGGGSMLHSYLYESRQDTRIVKTIIPYIVGVILIFATAFVAIKGKRS